jgi:hypothetical protein
MAKKLAAALLALALAHVAALAGAADKSRIGSGMPSRPGSVGPTLPGGGEPPGDPVNLQVDDGGFENCIGLTGAGGQFVWFNRFTPTEFPVGLTQIQVAWINDPGGCNLVSIGDSYDLFTWSDTDGNPANGAANVSSHTGQTVAAFNVFQSTSFTMTNYAGPGDILVGAVNRAGMDGPDFPASIDQTASQVRSWIGAYTTGNPPVPPPLPATAFYGTIDSFGLAGNWMVRASGVVTPVELMGVSIE